MSDVVPMPRCSIAGRSTGRVRPASKRRFELGAHSRVQVVSVPAVGGHTEAP